MAGRGEVIFEFIRIGGAVKVTAVDAATGIEASIVGDPAAGETTLKRLARRKLDYVLGKRAKERPEGDT
ncbi:MAG TPA: hypothetical protein VEI03_10040 [Stellaceae bacterium]|nr:hypothetical protein [Stellaceae bacterium]